MEAPSTEGLGAEGFVRVMRGERFAWVRADCREQALRALEFTRDIEDGKEDRNEENP